MFFAKVLLLASFSTLSVNAMYTPLAHRSPHQHRGLAARVAAAAPEVVPTVRVTPRKRAVKRCKGSSAPIPSPTDDSSASSTPTPSQAPVNAGNAPPVFSSSSVSPSPTPSSSSAEHSSIHPHISSSSLTPSSSPDVRSTSQPVAPVNPAPSPSIESSSTPPAVKPTPKPEPTPKPSSSPVVSSSRAPAEEPSPSPKPSPTTKKTTPAAVAPTPTPAKSSGGGGDSSTHSGDGTFYATGLGACGITNKDTDMIAAIAHGFFDSFGGGYTNPNNAPICNQRVRATYQGNSVDVTLTDRCGGCDGFALDFSPSAFQKLAPLGVGRIHDVEWTFI